MSQKLQIEFDSAGYGNVASRPAGLVPAFPIVTLADKPPVAPERPFTLALLVLDAVLARHDDWPEILPAVTIQSDVDPPMGEPGCAKPRTTH